LQGITKNLPELDPGVESVVLIRPAAVTRRTDGGQRRIKLRRFVHIT
jgi:hypothetical protein